jgi:hypothetical protein
MNTDRLLKLADRLANYVPEHAGKDIPTFDLLSWAGPLNAAPGENGDCGTVACAVGHACLIPEFNRAGLRLVKRIPVYTVPASEDCEEHDEDGWVAAVEFFNLKIGQANFLFDGRYYDARYATGPAAVARRIRLLVEYAGDVGAARAAEQKEVV